VVAGRFATVNDHACAGRDCNRVAHEVARQVSSTMRSGGVA
jgi:hypothetical protein